MPRIDVLGRLQSAGIRKGFFGTSRPWLIVGVTAWAIRRARGLVRREEAVVLREPLRPGESLLITHTREPHG